MKVSITGKTGWLKEIAGVGGDVKDVGVLGRRIARAIGKGVYCCGTSEHGHGLQNDKVVNDHYELTFGYSVPKKFGGGTNVVGRCFVILYR